MIFLHCIITAYILVTSIPSHRFASLSLPWVCNQYCNNWNSRILAHWQVVMCVCLYPCKTFEGLLGEALKSSIFQSDSGIQQCCHSCWEFALSDQALEHGRIGFRNTPTCNSWVPIRSPYSSQSDPPPGPFSIAPLFLYHNVSGMNNPTCFVQETNDPTLSGCMYRQVARNSRPWTPKRKLCSYHFCNVSVYICENETLVRGKLWKCDASILSIECNVSGFFSLFPLCFHASASLMGPLWA